MRAIPVLLFVMISLLAGAAHAGDALQSRTFQTNSGKFEFADGTLTITPKTAEHQDKTIIDKTGRLTIGEREITTDRSDRKLLKKFVRETQALAVLIEEVGAQVAQQVNSATDSGDTEKIAKRIHSLGETIDNQNAKVASVAMKLFDRIPELGALQNIFAQ